MLEIATGGMRRVLADAGRCVGLVTGRQPRILPRETPRRVVALNCRCPQILAAKLRDRAAFGDVYQTRRPASEEFDLQRIAGPT